MSRVFQGVALLFLAAPAAAGPSVESVAPAGGQRGTEFALTLSGSGLADAKELLLYSPGVSCAEVKAVSENEVRVRLKAAADCPLGGHALRLRTARGLSELRTFRITPFPVVEEKEDNNTPAEAQAVAANVTVAGRIEEGDTDCYKIELKKGQRLSAEVEAVRVGAALFDPVLTVYGPDGKELTTVDDTPLLRQDAFVSLTAPRDGAYVVLVRETNYGGDDNFRYLLHLGHFPRPAAVFPPGGPAGEEVALRFLGAGGEIAQTVRLPATADPDHGVHATEEGIPSPSPNPFRVSPFPNLIETEPNDDLGTATRAGRSLPLAFNGIIGRKGDVDHYRFRAARGDAFQFESFAYRLGSPLDTVVTILDAAGEVLVANDDDGSHDSRLRFVAPADGEYVLEVHDKRGQGGPEYVYRIEATVPRLELKVFLPRPNRLSQEGQALVVPRGNRVTTFLAVQRTGFDGEVTIRPGTLPAGVSLSVDPVPADCFLVPVVLEATADAPVGGALVELTATGKAADGKTVRGEFVQVVDLVGGPADALYQSAVVR